MAEHAIYSVTYRATQDTNAYIGTNLLLSQRRQFRSDKCVLRRSNLRLYGYLDTSSAYIRIYIRWPRHSLSSAETWIRL